MCRKCVDGKTYRHSIFKEPSAPRPPREHGTLRGCRQHWARGEELCDECEVFDDIRFAQRKKEERQRKQEKERLKAEKRAERGLSRTPQQTMATSLRLTVSSLDELARIAKEQGLSRNALIQRVIDSYLVL